MVHCRVCCRRYPCQSSITPFARQCTEMPATSNTYRIYSSVLDGEKVATTHAKVIISIFPESLNQFINFEMSHPHVHTRFARSDRWQRRPDGHSTWRQTLSVVGSNQLGHRLRRTKSTRRLHKDIRIQRLDQSNITILSFYIFFGFVERTQRDVYTWNSTTTNKDNQKTRNTLTSTAQTQWAVWPPAAAAAVPHPESIVIERFFFYYQCAFFPSENLHGNNKQTTNIMLILGK